MKVAAGLLAVRTLNQYRRRDVLAYLGLRYYLDNSASRSDRWAREVATDLVLRRSGPSYFAVQHFKDLDARGHVDHREIFLPSPNEALAETALIDACASAGPSFSTSKMVFSYLYANAEDSSGAFQNYMVGLRERHAAIAAACRRVPNARVQFFDIRRFYPSISLSLAKSVWIRACESSTISKNYLELGLKILSDHSRIPHKDGGGLLTGPMFSHLIANLVLRSVDEHLEKGSADYFRYVDDITFVGDEQQIKRSTDLLYKCLEPLGLLVHGPESSKSYSVSTSEWLEAEHDFTQRKEGPSWMTLIGDLKRLLVFRPELKHELDNAFMGEGFRIPVPDYAAAVGERGFTERLGALVQAKWFRARVRPLSIKLIIEQARFLRLKYFEESEELLSQIHSASTFNNKRSLPKLRYRLGRLAYLAPSDQLEGLAREVSTVSGMQFQAAVALAVATGKVDEVIRFGTNAAQAVAQPLRLSDRIARAESVSNDRSDVHALAVFRLNGLHVTSPDSHDQNNELLRFASNGADDRLMRSADKFIREISCLHGMCDMPRHRQILDSVFDPAEDITLDAIEQARQSFSL